MGKGPGSNKWKEVLREWNLSSEERAGAAEQAQPWDKACVTVLRLL